MLEALYVFFNPLLLQVQLLCLGGKPYVIAGTRAKLRKRENFGHRSLNLPSHSETPTKNDSHYWQMDHIDEIYRNRIAALTRALYAIRCVKEDNVPCKIEEGLFLGSVGAASNKNALKSLNITHILTVANLSALDWSTHPNDFIYKTINVADREDTDIAQYFDECLDFIDEAKGLGGGVLVHCFVGRSRSVTVVVAYLMKKYHMSLSQAMEHVRSKRPQAAPNSGFMLQLQNFEKSLQEDKGVATNEIEQQG
ncbi:hypothetical protein NE237_015621 [Protea cynaroides]|uniref:Dual specificity protein phosphatase 1 n=1 Tax=Protea cynaroides TaxID=273540 RepID=A0A9Q0QR41_9MAGN|nr:hypothetical protein NE237_015621 [Protea cynaroides]